MSSKVLLGLVLTLSANGINIVKNYFDKRIQLLLTSIAIVIWLVEYTFVYPSHTYIITLSFTLTYLLIYQKRKSLLRIFKLDIMFVAAIIFLLIAVMVSIITYEGPASILGIVIMFLDLFAVFMFTAQGLRFKSGFSALLYFIIDIGLGNFFDGAIDILCFLSALLSAIKYRGSRLIDKDGLREYYELIKITREARKYKKSIQ